MLKQFSDSKTKPLDVLRAIRDRLLIRLTRGIDQPHRVVPIGMNAPRGSLDFARMLKLCVRQETSCVKSYFPSISTSGRSLIPSALACRGSSARSGPVTSTSPLLRLALPRELDTDRFECDIQSRSISLRSCRLVTHSSPRLPRLRDR